MRRILLFLLIITTTISCKDCPDCPPAQDPSTANRGAANVQQTECKQVFVLKSRSLPTGWDNNIAICTRMFNDIYVSLANLTDEDKVTWLKRHGNHINYDLSYRYIEMAHIIEYEEEADANLQYTSFDLDLIKSKLGTAGTTFERDNYTHYVRLAIDSAGNRNITLTEDFVSNEDTASYSIPFFRSVVAQLKDSIPSNPTFQFSKTRINNYDKIFLRVIKRDGTYKYYDYSDEPGHGKNSPF